MDKDTQKAYDLSWIPEWMGGGWALVQPVERKVVWYGITLETMPKRIFQYRDDLILTSLPATAGSRLIIRHASEMLAHLEAAVSRLELASRTREGYALRCQECEAPHWLDTSIPSDIWNKIANPDAILCMLCIDDKLYAIGETVEAEFYFGRKLGDKDAEPTDGREDKQ